MKILKLTAENIKRLTAVEITPDGAVIKISGKNASGKTSVLDAIWWAMGGGDNIQDQPIHKGADKGKITLDLGELKVERRFTDKGTSLFVTNAAGMRHPSPQAVLDKLIGTLTFDPLEFMRLKPKEQFNQLRSIVNIGEKLDELDTDRQTAYDTRTGVNRQVKEKQGAINQYTIPDDAPDEVVSGSELLDKIQDAENVNRQNKEISDSFGRAKIHETALACEIDELENTLKTKRQIYDAATKATSELGSQVNNLKDVDVETMRSELSGLESKNEQARQNQARKALVAELKTHQEASENLTKTITDIDVEKTALMAETKFPTDGLSFEDGAVMYNELPLEQASSAEQLRVSMSIAMSANPDFRVIRITDGSLMDSDSFKLIEKMAEDNDYQIWVEVVDETGEVGIVIEDGKVAKVNRK